MLSKNIRIKTLVPIAWGLLIWAVSSIPSQDLPVIKIFGYDKLAHLGIYAILGILVNNCIGKETPRVTILLVYALLLLNASLDELHQTFIPGRSVSIWDLLANYSGLGLGLLLQLRKK